MKKLLIYLLLIACVETFMSATPCYCYRHKNLSNCTKINVSAKGEKLQQDKTVSEIHPLEIFTLRYF